MLDFQLIPEWKAVVAKAHSMWSMYLGIGLLILPELVFWLYGVDSNPRLIWWLALGFLIYGAVGRIKDQKIPKPGADE